MEDDNIQSSNALWDETRIAMKKQPDEEILEIFFEYQQFRCTWQDTVQ